MPSAGTFQIVVSGNYLYATAFDDGLRVIDISRPTSPNEVAFVSTPDCAMSVALYGRYAYVADGSGGVRIIDVNNPRSPVEVGSITDSGFEQMVAVGGHYLYVGDSSQGIRIYDIANPLHPAPLGNAFVYGAPSQAVIAGDYAYVSENDVRVYNIADPSHPNEVAAFMMPGPTSSLAVAGGHVYAASNEGGLVILIHTPSVSATIPTGGGTLVSPADGTSYSFLAGTFANSTTVRHTVRFAGSVPPFGNLVGIGHVYELAATSVATGQPVQPVAGHAYSVSVHYGEGAVGNYLENTLALYYWDGAAWIREPSSTVNKSTHTVSANPTHMSVWAILGVPRRLFLPVSLKMR